jgi:hypothetical protein
MRTLVARLVQHEVWVSAFDVFAWSWPGKPHVGVTPFVEQVGAEARALVDGLEELLGDDGVGVDVGAVERGHQTLVWTVNLGMVHGSLGFLRGVSRFSRRAFWMSWPRPSTVLQPAAATSIK